MSPLSASVAATGVPMFPAVATASSPSVSLKARDVLAPSVKVGRALVGVLVDPFPLADQLSPPSALVARTCTRYSVPVSRSPMVALSPVSFWGPSVQPVSVVFWYCRS